MKGKKEYSVYLQTLTMINLAIGWIEIRYVPETRIYLVADQVKFVVKISYLYSNLTWKTTLQLNVIYFVPKHPNNSQKGT